VALRLQDLQKRDQILVLAGITEARAMSGRFSPLDVAGLIDDIGLPRPVRISNVFASLEKDELLSRKTGKGSVWRLTPKGRHSVTSIFSESEISILLAESLASEGTTLAETRHPLVPFSLAPPELSQPLREFLDEHPFELNVFGMTRYPDESKSESDPVGRALTAASDVCSMHGLDFHLAIQRSISDDLWTNIAGHMWGSRYGVGFFENRTSEGINPNLAIEVGSMLMTGRRCALLKDTSIDKMPTDLVGKIYKSVDLDDPQTVESVMHSWIKDDLGLGKCQACV
jgi:hypothetical protein